MQIKLRNFILRYLKSKKKVYQTEMGYALHHSISRDKNILSKWFLPNETCIATAKVKMTIEFWL